MSFVDPKSDKVHEIEFGQVYSDSRTGNLIQLIYLDRNVYVLQNEEGSHRFGQRKEFDRYVSSGRYSLELEAERFADTGVLGRVRDLKREYEQEDGRTAAHKAEALEEALAILSDLGSDEALEDVPFEELDNIGGKAAQNLREEGYETRRDVREATDNELLDVPWVGEKGVTSIREYV